MLVNLDIHTVENVSARYLMELYTQTQEEISKFIHARIEGSGATLGDWDEFHKWNETSENIRKILVVIMDYDEYSNFMEKIYKKFYPSKKS